MLGPRYPALCQVNTRVWLTDLSQALGKRATLDDISDVDLDRLAELGFDGAWFLSVWKTSPAAQAVSRANPEWRGVGCLRIAGDGCNDPRENTQTRSASGRARGPDNRRGRRPGARC